MMKKTTLLLLMVLCGFAATAQTLQTSARAAKEAAEVSTVYVQLIGDEDPDSPELKLKAVIGKDQQFYVHDKRDFEIYDQMDANINSFSLMPDALNYLADKGFVLVSHQMVNIDGRIRHVLLLSKSTLIQ